MNVLKPTAAAEAEGNSQLTMLDAYSCLDLTGGHSGLAASILGNFGMSVFRAVKSGEVGSDGVTSQFENSAKQLWVADSEADITDVAGKVDVILVDETTQARWGVDARALDASTDAIVCAITPYGLDGPYASRPASELTLMAAGGQLHPNG